MVYGGKVLLRSLRSRKTQCIEHAWGEKKPKGAKGKPCHNFNSQPYSVSLIIAHSSPCILEGTSLAMELLSHFIF